MNLSRLVYDKFRLFLSLPFVLISIVLYTVNDMINERTECIVYSGTFTFVSWHLTGRSIILVFCTCLGGKKSFKIIFENWFHILIKYYLLNNKVLFRVWWIILWCTWLLFYLFRYDFSMVGGFLLYLIIILII